MNILLETCKNQPLLSGTIPSEMNMINGGRDCIDLEAELENFQNPVIIQDKNILKPQVNQSIVEEEPLVSKIKKSDFKSYKQKKSYTKQKLAEMLQYTNTVPFVLRQPFQIVEGYVAIYLSYLQYEEIDLTIVLVTSQPLQITPEFQLWRKIGEKVVSENCKLVKCEQEPLKPTIDQFKNLFRFFFEFSSDQYEKPFSEQDFITQFKETTSTTSKTRNYFWIPGTRNLQIDMKLLSSFLEFKRDPLATCHNLWDIIVSKREDITESTLREDNAILREFPFTTKKQIRSKLPIKFIGIYFIFMAPKNITVHEMFDKMFLESDQEITQIQRDMQYAKLSDESEDILSENIYHTIYENTAIKNSSFTSYRKNIQKQEEDQNCTIKNLPICFAKFSTKITNFDYLNNQHQKLNEFAYREPARSVFIKGSIPLVFNCWNLIRYPISFENLDKFARIPSLLSAFERSIFPQEVQQRFQLAAKLSDIYTATNSPSYDNNNNFENKELIGDSVLKFITCYCIYINNPDINESDCTSIKSKQVSNYNLMQLGKRVGLGKFIWSMKKHPKNWTPTGFQQKEEQVTNKINGKMIADVVEALIGATLESELKILHSVIFLHQLGYEPLDGVEMKEEVFNESLLIPAHMVNDIETLEYKPELTFLQLFKIGIWKTQRQNHKKCSQQLQHLQENILLYKFKDLNLLQEALTYQVGENTGKRDYQTIEFLGDAVFEVYLTANLFQFLKTYQPSDSSQKGAFIKGGCQGILHKFKVFLLSNSFMARMTLLLQLHKFIQNGTDQLQQQITEFEQIANLESTFCMFLTNEQTKAPKILGDIWESVAGAVFLDGGWNAVHQVFGRLLYPYLLYFAFNQGCCLLDLNEKIHKFVLEKKLQMDVKKSKIRLNDEKIHEFSVYVNGAPFIQVHNKSDDIAKKQGWKQTLEKLQKIYQE